ncbi:hypothetical protein ACQPUZ_03585 [Clostridium tertium]
MMIRTQNKKDIVDVVRVSISYKLSIANKVTIVGYYRTMTLLLNNTVTLGIYDEKDVMEEMDKIHSFFIENPNSIYQMSELKL